VLCVSGVPLVLDLILILACLGSGLMAGLFVAFSTFLMKALGSLPADEGIRTMQAINTFIVRPSFLIVFLGTAVLLLVAVYLSLGEQVSGYIIAATLSYIFMCLGSTIAFNVPLNNRLDGCDSEERKAHEFLGRLLNHLDKVEPHTINSLRYVCAALGDRFGDDIKKHNQQLKSLVATLRLRAKQLVTATAAVCLASATQTPERLRGSTVY
jgi:uncharacterized membrane protein